MGLLGKIGRGFRGYLDSGVNASLAGAPPGLLNLEQTGIGPTAPGAAPMMTPQERQNLRANYLMHLGQGIQQMQPAAHLDEFRNEQLKSAEANYGLRQQQQLQSELAAPFQQPPAAQSMGSVAAPPIDAGASAPVAGSGAAPVVAPAVKPGDVHRALARVYAMHGMVKEAKTSIEAADLLDKDPTKENFGSTSFVTKDKRSYLHQPTKEGPGIDTLMDPSATDLATIGKTKQQLKELEIKYYSQLAQDPTMSQGRWTAARAEASPELQAQMPIEFSPKAAEALQRMGVSPDQVAREDAAANRPDPQTVLRSNYGKSFAKLEAAGFIKPSDVTDLSKTVAAFKSAPESIISKEEKAAAIGYLGANPTIASQGTVANIRVEGFQAAREYPVIDKRTGDMVMMDAGTINRSKGQFAPASGGAAAMGKEAVFQDLHYNIDTARKAVQGLEGMTPGNRAVLSYVLKHTDPSSAMQTFLAGAAGTTLTDPQREAAQALALLSENALSLRSVAGMGQGSDDLRAAIQATLPSGKSPDKKYMLEQLDKFEQVVKRLQGGVPTVRNNTPATPSPSGNLDKLMNLIQGLPNGK